MGNHLCGLFQRHRLRKELRAQLSDFRMLVQAQYTRWTDDDFAPVRNKWRLVTSVTTNLPTSCSACILLDDGHLVPTDRETEKDFELVAKSVHVVRRAAQQVALEMGLDTGSVLHLRGSNTIVSIYELGHHCLVMVLKVKDAI